MFICLLICQVCEEQGLKDPVQRHGFFRGVWLSWRAALGFGKSRMGLAVEGFPVGGHGL